MTALAANITATQTLIPVDAGLTNGSFQLPLYYTVDSEAIRVTGRAHRITWLVERGIAGTTAASHSSAATLTRYYPEAATGEAGAAGVTVDNQSDPPAEVTTLVAPGATIDGDEATLVTGTPVMLVEGEGYPTDGSNQQYSLYFNGSVPSSGTWRLDVDGTDTSNLAWNATMAQLLAAIEVIVGEDNVAIATGSGGQVGHTLEDTLYIEFVGEMARTVVVVTLAADTTGGDVTVDEDQAGEASVPAGVERGSWYLDTLDQSVYQNVGTLNAPEWQLDDRTITLTDVLTNGAVVPANAIITGANSAVDGTLPAQLNIGDAVDGVAGDFVAAAGRGAVGDDGGAAKLQGGAGDEGSGPGAMVTAFGGTGAGERGSAEVEAHTLGLVLNAIAFSVLAGAADPSAGAGIVAAGPSLYLRSDAGVGELWLKVGAADTAWEQVTTT